MRPAHLRYPTYPTSSSLLIGISSNSHLIHPSCHDFLPIRKLRPTCLSSPRTPPHASVRDQGDTAPERPQLPEEQHHQCPTPKSTRLPATRHPFLCTYIQLLPTDGPLSLHTPSHPIPSYRVASRRSAITLSCLPFASTT
ncbi:hypothetical protein LX32DRAFT_126707 [Colletotrichum zoysiae]|uniref:Uncharacterized protein n=1 Tax=Colletotrichum zoysiae TaxID=1216348 RepID=A0AAD9LWM0_9PEZI|nr:hypothetical protein LX32DRAFT_126707 [Colletotrichum zoysiae]